MIRLFSCSPFVLIVLVTLLGESSVSAQDFGRDRGDRRDRDRGDRGDSGRDRGGFGGGFGGPSGPTGGPPGFGGGFGGPPSGFGGGFGPPGMSGGPGFSGGFGPPGGFGGGFGPPGGFSGRSMMDSNGNGKIDQEEIDRMPSFVRDMMKARGVELKAGMSVDDMRNSFRNSSGSPDQAGQPGQPGSQPGGNSVQKALTPYKMKPKKPLTLTLPPAYSEVDTDFDGQIGMHEWMSSRRTDLDRFDEMDIDYDGYLTPEELQAAEALAASQKAIASTERKKLTIISATPARAAVQPGNPGNRPDNNGPGQGNPWGGRGDSSSDPAAYATMSFDRLDANRDGYVDPDEWQQSRRVRGMFEQAGIRLDKMSKDQFMQNFKKVSGGMTSG